MDVYLGKNEVVGSQSEKLIFMWIILIKLSKTVGHILYGTMAHNYKQWTEGSWAWMRKAVI